MRDWHCISLYIWSHMLSIHKIVLVDSSGMSKDRESRRRSKTRKPHVHYIYTIMLPRLTHSVDPKFKVKSESHGPWLEVRTMTSRDWGGLFTETNHATVCYRRTYERAQDSSRESYKICHIWIVVDWIRLSKRKQNIFYTFDQVI